MNLADSSAMGPPPTNHFFSLPRELRDAIYEGCTFEPLAISMIQGKHPEWLLANKQIFFEAAPPIYRKGCLHHEMTDLVRTDLLDQVWMSYESSFPKCSIGSKRNTFMHVKRMLSNIAIDVQLDMTVPQITQLFEQYFSRLNELPNLKNLYISLHPIPGRDFSQFRQQLSRSDLRIFQVVSFVKPVEALLARKPKSCTIHWMIPDSVKLAMDCEAIRLAADGEVYRPRLGNRPEIAEFMKEVEDAVAAMEPQDYAVESRADAEAIDRTN